jgi:putative nucleotidyltransferase with HDIG domain
MFCFRLIGTTGMCPGRNFNAKSKRNPNISMLIPSRTESLELLLQFDVPDHIRAHSLLVAEVALFLAVRLNQNSCRLDLQLIEAAALLHDIAKMPGLTTGEDHAALGAQMLDGIVHPSIPRIVKEHTSLVSSQVAGPITESLIVNYSDKRVMHDRVVSVQQRFEDLIARYAKGFAREQLLRSKLGLYSVLETTIFSHLAITPHDAEIMGLTIERIEGV